MQPWYRENQRLQEELAKSLGFEKVSQLKLAVVKNIGEFAVAEASCLLCVALRILMTSH
jgi:hypothetical protein